MQLGGLLAITVSVMLSSAAFAEKKERQPAAGQQQQQQQQDTTTAKPKKKGLLDTVNGEVSGQGYGMAGCGLGSVLLGEKEGIVQIFSATLNNISANQTFGMTSGTSNCDSYKDMASIRFIEDNRANLESDVARGGGETLESLSKMMGCQHDVGTLQNRYTEIFQETKDSRKVYFSIRHNLNCQG
jgi:hypothetical protein